MAPTPTATVLIGGQVIPIGHDDHGWTATSTGDNDE